MWFTACVCVSISGQLCFEMADMFDVYVCCTVYVCVWFGCTSLVGTRSSHKDSTTRKIRTSGDISPVPTRKKYILGLGVRFRVTIGVRGYRVRFSFRVLA